MANEQAKMFYALRKNTNESMPKAFGNYYAEPVLTVTLSARALARHMVKHGIVRNSAKVETVLTKMDECIPELIGQGIGVELSGLGRFYPTIESVGVDDPTKFNAATDIKGIHIRFAPLSTNEDNLTSKAFKKQVSFQQVGVLRGTKKTSRRIIPAIVADAEDEQE